MAFLRTRPCGIYWLQAPAHVGKTTFAQGLDARTMDDPLFPPNDLSSCKVAVFQCKREYRTGIATFLNGIERAIERALDIRADAKEQRRQMPSLAAADLRRRVVEWVDAWRDFGRRQHSAAELPRLLLVIDGLDEADDPRQPDSLLHVLPSPGQLTAGLYLLLTSRRADDADCPAWLGPTILRLLDGGSNAASRVIGLKDPEYTSRC